MFVLTRVSPGPSRTLIRPRGNPSNENMGANRPHFVGIAGGSCSGKTWLAGRLHKLLGKESARLSLDDFYQDRGHLSLARRAKLNFDHPRAIDWDLFETVLRTFAEGHDARVPKYNFSTHARETEQPLLSPKPVLLVEGLWLFRRPSVRQIFDRKVFLRLPESVCEARRVARDVRERGREETAVRQQWCGHTQPMYKRYVEPQARWADVVWDAVPDEPMVAALADEIRQTVTRHSDCL